MKHPDCIFCKIVEGTIPAVKVFENDRILAFMDIGPIIKGHTLVIPKTHYNPIMDTPDAVLAELMTIVRKIAQAQVEGLHADGINITQSNGACAGQAVPHLHFHVIPRFNLDGHHWNWDAKRYESPAEMTQYAERIIAGFKATAQT